MRVAGIDLSTHAVDIVTVGLHTDAEPPVWRRFELNGADSFTRARAVRDAMCGRTDEYWDNILAIGIEDPAGHHGTNHIYRIQGAVLQCLPALVLVQQWRPAAWKKSCGLLGNAPKASVTIHSRELLGVRGDDLWDDTLDTWPQDAHDAHCIALATRAVIQVGEQAA